MKWPSWINQQFRQLANWPTGFLVVWGLALVLVSSMGLWDGEFTGEIAIVDFAKGVAGACSCLMLAMLLGFAAGVQPFVGGRKFTAFGLALVIIIQIGVISNYFNVGRPFRGPASALDLAIWLLIFFIGFSAAGLCFPKTWLPIAARTTRPRMRLGTMLLWVALAAMVFGQLTTWGGEFRGRFWQALWNGASPRASIGVFLLVGSAVAALGIAPPIGVLLRTRYLWTWVLFLISLPFWILVGAVLLYRLWPNQMATTSLNPDWESGLFSTITILGIWWFAILFGVLERWRRKKAATRLGVALPFWSEGKGKIRGLARISLLGPATWAIWWISSHGFIAWHYDSFVPQREMFRGVTGIRTADGKWPLQDYFETIQPRVPPDENLAVLYYHTVGLILGDAEPEVCRILGIEPNPLHFHPVPKLSRWLREESYLGAEQNLQFAGKSPRVVKLRRDKLIHLEDLTRQLDPILIEFLLANFEWDSNDYALAGKWSAFVSPQILDFCNSIGTRTRISFPPRFVESGHAIDFWGYDANTGFRTFQVLINQALKERDIPKAIVLYGASQRLLEAICANMWHGNLDLGIHLESLVRIHSQTAVRIARDPHITELESRKLWNEWLGHLEAIDRITPKLNRLQVAMRLTDTLAPRLDDSARHTNTSGEFFVDVAPWLVDWHAGGEFHRKNYETAIGQIFHWDEAANTLANLNPQLLSQMGLAGKDFGYLAGLSAWMGSPRDKGLWIACQFYEGSEYLQFGTFRMLSNARLEVRLTICALAIERFRLAEGRLPATLDELKNKFEIENPDEWLFRDSLKYKPAGHRYSLCSIGSNGTDENGRGDDIRFSQPWDRTDVAKYVQEELGILIEWVE